MTIRAMTLEDLNTALDWAEDEGWNPGLEDAAAFYAADPAGFLVKDVQGEPVAAISVVNHDAAFAFLGLYLCKPQYRGQGHGMDIWRAGIAHAGARCIGLDGVPGQQANYSRSGFVKTGSTVRFTGRITAQPDPRVRAALAEEVPHLVALDAQTVGMGRTDFSTTWLSSTSTRQTLVLQDQTQGADIRGFATFRRCGQGTKIGPLHALCAADALALLASNPFGAGPGDLFIDTQGHDSQLALLLKSHGFEPTFETARMFTKAPPVGEVAPFYAIATMELG